MTGGIASPCRGQPPLASPGRVSFAGRNALKLQRFNALSPAGSLTTRTSVRLVAMVLKLVFRFLLLLALVPYAGPFTPAAGQCEAAQEQECQSPDCEAHCALCACTLDRPVTISEQVVSVQNGHVFELQRPVGRELHVSPPSSEIPHVPKTLV